MYNKRRKSYYGQYGYSGQMLYGIPANFPFNTEMYRNHPNPYQVPFQSLDWLSYQPQNPYYPQQYQPLSPNLQGYALEPAISAQKPYSQGDSQFLFQNPLQPQEDAYQSQNPFPQYMDGFPVMNPYPTQTFMPKHPSGMQSFINSFKSQDGSIDFNKMMNAAGQMMNAVTQVSSLVKGLGGLFKA